MLLGSIRNLTADISQTREISFRPEDSATVRTTERSEERDPAAALFRCDRRALHERLEARIVPERIEHRIEPK